MKMKSTVLTFVFFTTVQPDVLDSDDSGLNVGGEYLRDGIPDAADDSETPGTQAFAADEEYGDFSAPPDEASRASYMVLAGASLAGLTALF